MNLINLRIFISALRSGEYTQTMGRLKKPGVKKCYCAEGLLGHLAGVSDKSLAALSRLHNFLPLAVYENFLGVHTKRIIPFYHNNPRYDCIGTLVYLNDNLGMSFREIARNLEARYFPS
jgi:hypothetical protein